MAMSVPEAPDIPVPVGAQPGRLLFAGAEAEVRLGSFLGRTVVEKRRLPKEYRHPALDHLLRAQRTRDEAGLLVAARRAGVPVPLLYDVDRASSTLRMEHVPGRTLREVLATQGDTEGHMHRLGQSVARLHDAALTHGDLTTSNVLVPTDEPETLRLIDFGLGAASAEAEPRGVDLHLLEEALEATHARAKDLFAAFLEAYLGHCAAGPEAVGRLEAIRLRGRNR